MPCDEPIRCEIKAPISLVFRRTPKRHAHGGVWCEFVWRGQ
jgi:hypothetical protein